MCEVRTADWREAEAQCLGSGDGGRAARRAGQRKTEGAWDVRRALRAWWHGFENFERSVSKL